MKTRPRIRPHAAASRRLAAVLLLGSLPLAAHAQASDRTEGAPAAATAEAGSAVDALAPYQAELLELAYEAVSGMPLHPHVKNRSRAQEQVVAAALQLGDGERAQRYVEGIENWRRGAGYADLAYFLAERGGDSDEVRRLLGLAEQIAAWPEEELKQEWRRDRILAKVARTHLLLGERERAAALEETMSTAEEGAVRVEEARMVADETFDQQLVDLAHIVEQGTFDQVRMALDACVAMYARAYADPERRERIAAEVFGSYDRTPMTIRLELLLAMADAAIEHDDFANALALTERGREKLASVTWLPEDEVPLRARFATRRAQAGELDEARAEIEAALAMFVRGRERIVDIFRAEALVPVAEAFVAAGSYDQARTVYRRALTEAVVNPNSRPRADDLSLVCLSMAQHGVEPDERLWDQLRTIAKGLGDPW